MKIFVYDDRFVLPPYFQDFIALASSHGILTLITNASVQDKAFKNCGAGLEILSLQDLPKWTHISSLFDSIYIHRSSNSVQFEKSCFLRWFAYDVASRGLDELDYLCILDSDQALFMHPNTILDDCVLSISAEKPELITWLPEDWKQDVIEAGPSLTIMTKRCLSAFCDFLIASFFSTRNISRLNSCYYHSLLTAHGSSVSDMTALAYFVAETRIATFSLGRHFLPISDYFFCENVHYYLTSAYTGSIVHALSQGTFIYEGSKLWLEVKGLRSRVIGLHFQGFSKPLLKLFASRPQSILIAELEGYLNHQDPPPQASTPRGYGFRILNKSRRLLLQGLSSFRY